MFCHGRRLIFASSNWIPQHSIECSALRRNFGRGGGGGGGGRKEVCCCRPCSGESNSCIEKKEALDYLLSCNLPFISWAYCYCHNIKSNVWSTSFLPSFLLSLHSVDSWSRSYCAWSSADAASVNLNIFIRYSLYRTHTHVLEMMIISIAKELDGIDCSKKCVTYKINDCSHLWLHSSLS